MFRAVHHRCSTGLALFRLLARFFGALLSLLFLAGDARFTFGDLALNESVRKSTALAKYDELRAFMDLRPGSEPVRQASPEAAPSSA